MALAALARKIFGSPSDRQVKRYQGKVAAINALEPELAKLSDEQLRARTQEFKAQLAQGASLDDLIVPAFATVREASKRVLGMRHFDVQLIGGMVLNDRAIAEMRTGEGKTLVATLAVYLNALTGNGVHVVTVNDYLARRDAGWMGQIYNFLGLSYGIIVHGLNDQERRDAYAADITYGTNNEFGFDYLRDNMKYARNQMVQRGHAYAIVDEVDSILIDEARTPLIISGPSEDRSELYIKVDSLMPIIGEDDFELDEKLRAATFTDQGVEKLEAAMTEAGLLKSGSMYDVENVMLVHHANSALRAHKLFRKDKDYIVRNDEVVIIDEFSGRMMPGRRYSEGLHQALEAKERVKIQAENQTLASITFQNYFRLYKKLAGMTGTALTEAEEFADIYSLGVITIPTNLPVQRIDEDDAIYRTAAEKFDAIAELIKECQLRGQPVLVGTTSIEKSEMLADLLRQKNVGQMNVLNARHHEQEAFIVADAGLPGAITIATNMAGRGTDIQLGGNLEMRIEKEAAGLEGAERDAKIAEIKAVIAEEKKKALAAGGLMVIGTERHESRRIDNQLRGRSGRQGDPGHSKFYLSLQDDLMRIFPVDSMDSMLGKLGLEQGESITHPWVTKAIERAQGKVESRNFDIRKNILKYDDVMNDQRKVIFEQRLEFMDAEDVSETITDMRHDVVANVVAKAIPPRSYPEQWNSEELEIAAKTQLNVAVPVREWAKEEGIDAEIVEDRIREAADALIANKEERFSANIMRQVEKSILLQSVDGLWREHLVMLDHLSKVVGWRGIAQRDPLTEYKQEAYELFQGLLGNLREQVTSQMAHVEIQMRQPEPPPAPDFSRMAETHIDPLTGENDADGDEITSPEGLPPIDPKLLVGVSRNAPCPCGSGKKFKHCHGAFA
ncbi:MULTISPECIES: preprotein translocase subunit SecA [Devosia]|uniref:Protein translocase subunit SecA n=1 Tax=Devosia equisanguinis TaxID=2490941 RepID=A0A3S4CSK1_9HYPH|nr:MULTISPECIES: preprotein translocase subunit SecA [Devosia]ODT51173.1 MAG: preprotein translocase subunit SecA [Pelagibacterium sp. SCN 63-126]OJX41636.1 MAG: preprotein translocase subunit SecA [Devosia sp. 63-57]VDS04940.1 preprotein translocase subunit SecA [Devosia equisanguinis]